MGRSSGGDFLIIIASVGPGVHCRDDGFQAKPFPCLYLGVLHALVSVIVVKQPEKNVRC